MIKSIKVKEYFVKINNEEGTPVIQCLEHKTGSDGPVQVVLSKLAKQLLDKYYQLVQTKISPQKNPHGVLYFEIKEPNSFVKQLNKEPDMKTSPSTMVDLMLSNVCKGYYQYDVLPDGQYAGIALIKETLSIAASTYTKAYNRVPVLLIKKVHMLFNVWSTRQTQMDQCSCT